MSEDQESAILDKIRKLLEVTKENGATEGEVENAMKMAQRLMMKHNIDQDSLVMSPLDIDITVIEADAKYTEPRDWLWQLLEIVGKGYNCRILRKLLATKRNEKTGDYRHHAGRERVYEIVGMEDDRKVVKNVYETIVPIIRNLISIRYSEYRKKTEFPKSRHAFTGSYISGFLQGLDVRLTRDRKEVFFIPEEIMKYELMVVKKDDLVRSYIDEKIKPRQVNLGGQQEVVSEALTTGYKDGQEENGSKRLH